MVKEEELEAIIDAIDDTVKAHMVYAGYHDKKSEDYAEGWNAGLDGFSTDLLGRKSEDSKKKLAKTAGVDIE